MSETKSDDNFWSGLGCLVVLAIPALIWWGISRHHKLIWLGWTLPKIELMAFLPEAEGRDLKARVTNCEGKLWGNELTCDLMTRKSFKKIEYDGYLTRDNTRTRTDRNQIYVDYPGFWDSNCYWLRQSFTFHDIGDVDSLEIWIIEE